MDAKNTDDFFSLDVCQRSGFHKASVLLVWPLFQEKFYSFVFKKFLVWWEGYLSEISLWESTISIFEKHWRIIAKNEFSSFSSQLPPWRHTLEGGVRCCGHLLCLWQSFNQVLLFPSFLLTFVSPSSALIQRSYEGFIIAPFNMGKAMFHGSFSF